MSKKKVTVTRICAGKHAVEYVLCATLMEHDHDAYGVYRTEGAKDLRESSAIN